MKAGTGAGSRAAARIAMIIHQLPPEKIVPQRASEAVLIPACVSQRLEPQHLLQEGLLWTTAH